MSVTTLHGLTLDGLDVEYTYVPESRGHRDRYGAPEEPDEPAHVEINSVKYNGHEIHDILSDDDIETLTEKINSELEDAHNDYEDQS
jgi:hypothetical protein